MFVVLPCKPGFDLINFEIDLIFLIKSFFYVTKKSRQKFKYFENEKKLLGWKKTFFIILRGCQLPKFDPDIRVRL